MLAITPEGLESSPYDERSTVSEAISSFVEATTKALVPLLVLVGAATLSWSFWKVFRVKEGVLND